MMRYKNVLDAAENDPRPEKRHLGTAQLEYGEALMKMDDPVGAELYLTRAVETLTKPGSNAWSQQIQYAQNKLAEAKAAKVERLARVEAARRKAVETTATEATQRGQIVSTPALAKILGNLKAGGAGADMAGTSK